MPRLPFLDALAVLIVVATMRQGAFYPPDDLLVPGAALAVAAACCAVRGADRLAPRDAVVGVALLGFSVHWSVMAATKGDLTLSRQAIGSAIGFLAAYLIGRCLDDGERRALVLGCVWFASLVAVIGLIGLAYRVEPFALPAQGRFRLAGTLTYSNATGAMLAMLLVVAVRAPVARLRDAQLVAVVGALIATQSRGALLAVVIGAAVRASGRERAEAVHVPVACGAVVGAVAVATSGGTTPGMLLLGPTAALMALAAALTSRRLRAGRSAVALVAVAAVSAMALGGVELWQAVRDRADTASVSDRRLEWDAAWQAFESSPLVGTGPGNRLRLADGRSARFAHNEPLQVAADVGLVGVVALALAALAAAGRPRSPRSSPAVDGARAVVAAFVVCGLLDFPWHLPAITMTVGLLATGLPLRGRTTA